MTRIFVSSFLLKHSLTIFLGIIFAGCSERHTTPRDTLIIGIPNEVKNLDIRFTRDKNAYKIIQLFSQALLDLNSRGELEGEIATTYYYSSERKKIHFPLKEKNFFSDGKKLRSSDIIFSFQDANRPGVPLKKWFDDVQSYSFDKEKNEFVIELKKASPFFVYRVVPLIKILPQALAQKSNFHLNPVGSGPYVLEQKNGRDIILHRNEYFHPRAHYEKIIFRTVSDSSSRFMALMARDIDILLGNMSFQKIEALKNAQQIRVLQKPGSNLEYIGYNTKSPFFTKREVRSYLDSLIPREEIVKHKFLDQAQLATSLFPKTHAFYSELNTTSIERNTLKKSPHQAKSLRLLCSSDKDTISWLLPVKEAWEGEGLKIDIKSYEFATFYSLLKKGDYDAFAFRLNTKKDPGFLFDLFHSSQHPPRKNRFFYADSRSDKILEEIITDISPQKRHLLMKQALERVLSDKILSPLWHKKQTMLLNKDIQNFNWENSWKEIIYSHKISKSIE